MWINLTWFQKTAKTLSSWYIHVTELLFIKLFKWHWSLIDWFFVYSIWRTDHLYLHRFTHDDDHCRDGLHPVWCARKMTIIIIIQWTIFALFCLIFNACYYFSGSAHNRDRPPSGISVRNRPSDANGNVIVNLIVTSRNLLYLKIDYTGPYYNTDSGVVSNQCYNRTVFQWGSCTHER